MSTWMIVTARIHDRAAFLSGYAPAAARLVAEHGGEYVLRAPGAHVLEWGLDGETPEGSSVVISRWPNSEAALAFWNCADYAAAKSLRNGIADCTVMIVDEPG